MRVVRENPVLVLVLGLCPALAVTTRLIDALWISLGILIVLVGSSVVVFFLARAVSGAVHRSLSSPGNGFRAASLLTVASLTSLYDLAMRLLAPEPRAALGVYLPVIAVNCLVLGRSELSGSERSARAAVMRSLESALSFAVVAAALAAVREAIGSGTLTLFRVAGFSGTIVLPFLRSAPALVALSAAGGLLLVGYMAGGLQWLAERHAAAGSALSQPGGEGAS